MARDYEWLQSPAIDASMGTVTVVMPFKRMYCGCNPNVYIEASPGAKFACCSECGRLFAIAQ